MNSWEHGGLGFQPKMLPQNQLHISFIAILLKSCYNFFLQKSYLTEFSAN